MTFTGSIVVDAALSRLIIDFVPCLGFIPPEGDQRGAWDSWCTAVEQISQCLAP